MGTTMRRRRSRCSRHHHRHHRHHNQSRSLGPTERDEARSLEDHDDGDERTVGRDAVVGNNVIYTSYRSYIYYTKVFVVI